MKSIVLILALLASNAFASTVCEMLENDENLFNIENRQVKKGVHFSPDEQECVIRYVASFGDFANDFNLHTFENIAAFYTDEYSYDDLSLGVYFDLSSGDQFTYVWSYPGDTHVGTWFDENGSEVAANSDGDFICLSPL